MSDSDRPVQLYSVSNKLIEPSRYAGAISDRGSTLNSRQQVLSLASPPKIFRVGQLAQAFLTQRFDLDKPRRMDSLNLFRAE